jgi:glycosyltransferase involved in cell wall biosynthesis
MKKKKSILFLSGLDFKEKSIQVIQKTPEAYVKNGWDVYYIVVRDNSKKGNYYYEKEINIPGVKLTRLYFSFSDIRSKINIVSLNTLISKIDSYIATLKLAYYGNKILNKNRIDVIYGYETPGVIAIKILNLFGKTKKTKIITRFQGTWLSKYLKDHQYLKLVFNLDFILALRTKASLCIMTDDGTQGDYAFRRFNSKETGNFRFWTNGVDEQKLNFEDYADLVSTYKKNGEFIMLSVSRLENWKKVERNIMILSRLLHTYHITNIKYIIVGEGNQKGRYQALVLKEGLSDFVYFVGGIANSEVKRFLNLADMFLSFYDLSNVGNPLLEAIRANKIIFTLNNGDTGKWIKHYENGFIYDIDINLYDIVAHDINILINNIELQKKIKENISKTEKLKLKTWDQRMMEEVQSVEMIINL